MPGYEKLDFYVPAESSATLAEFRNYLDMHIGLAIGSHPVWWALVENINEKQRGLLLQKLASSAAQHIARNQAQIASLMTLSSP